jgi:hypothetical protein
MIRTILTPKNSELHLSIPDTFIGKQVEILIYTTDEAKGDIKEEKAKVSISSLKGKLNLNDNQYEDFHKYLNQSRAEWVPIQ